MSPIAVPPNGSSSSSSTTAIRRNHPFPSNTPGSAIDLTEMAISTPPTRPARLYDDTPSPPQSRPESVVDLNDDIGHGNGHENGHGNGHEEGSFREEVYDHGKEEVGVEMGGIGDLAVLLRTIDFAAQVSSPSPGVVISAHEQKHSCQRRKDVDQTP